MFWSFDTCQNKVFADQKHVTISRAQVGPYRDQLVFLNFIFKLTADQGLVVDWIAGSSHVRHSHLWPVSQESRNFTGHFRVSQFPLYFKNGEVESSNSTDVFPLVSLKTC